MSYLYDAVKKAIGGVNVSKKMQKMADWSPNNIRAVYIMRDFVLVSYYTKMPKLSILDPNEVGLDLQKPNRIGSLNNLLANRQLSCMEEIYVDSAFQMYPNVMDLQKYVNTLISASSRLRYYSYVEGINGSELEQIYSKVKLDGVMDFTYARSVGGFKYVDAENDDWYRKYNLRPQYYSMDEDGKELSTIFKKCKAEKVAQADAMLAALQLEEKQKQWVTKAVRDAEQYKYLGLLFTFLTKIGELEPNVQEIFRVSKIVKDTCTFKMVKGLNGTELAAILKKVDGKAKDSLVNIFKIYTSQAKIIDVNTSNQYSEEEYRKSHSVKFDDEGFLQILTKLDTMACEIQKTGSNSPIGKMMIARSKGAFGDKPTFIVGSRTEGKSREGLDTDPSSECLGYVNYIMGYCGWNVDSFKAYIRG